MKKFFGIALIGATMALSACAGGQSTPAADVSAVFENVETAETELEVAETSERQLVTVTYFDAAGVANTADVWQNPRSVAVFDWSILDILYSVGWENTGIETLIIPNTAELPAEIAWFEEQDFVIRGGTLHYVNWDVLDLVQPELVILGTRSFAHNAAGETTDADTRAALRAEADANYPNTAFVRLTQNSARSELAADMEHNVYVLQEIFPNIAEELQEHLERTLADLAALREQVQESGATALFVMVWADRVSIFLPEGRFHMIYDEFGFTSAVEELPQWGDQHGFDARAEFILSANPDVILLLDRTDMASPTGGVGVQNFMADSIIQNTAAAQNGNIFVLEGNAWYTVTGGFAATETKIANVMRFVEGLE